MFEILRQGLKKAFESVFYFSFSFTRFYGNVFFSLLDVKSKSLFDGNQITERK